MLYSKGKMYNQQVGYATSPTGYNQPMHNTGIPMTGAPMHHPGAAIELVPHNHQNGFPAIRIPDTQPFSQPCTCTTCGAQITTTVERTITFTAICLIILLVLIFWPLCWLPCCYDYSFKYVHSCPSCRAVLSYDAGYSV